eukprot:scaffold655211_cov53-Prasinocladus_malaysianus.AAC.1
MQRRTGGFGVVGLRAEDTHFAVVGHGHQAPRGPEEAQGVCVVGAAAPPHHWVPGLVQKVHGHQP